MRMRSSPNHDPRPRDGEVDMLVLHYTGMPSAAAALDRLMDPAAKVSAHYLIDEDGGTYQLVGEDRRAWHAGVAAWRRATDVNARSVGIELVNPGHEFGYRDFPDAQIEALLELAPGILKRHRIPARNVVGHADVAPARKADPGEKFPWRRLAAAGIGLWPDREADAEPGDVGTLLSAYGYDVSDLPAAITAFQRHFRQAKVDGAADAETARCLARLVEMAAG